MAGRVGTLANLGECLRKRPQRKGNLTKLENHIDEYKGKTLAERSLTMIQRDAREAIPQQQEYERVQNTLIEFMIEDAAEEEAIKKETADLADLTARFENASCILLEMEEASVQYREFSEIQEEVELILENLVDVDYKIESVQDDIERMKDNMPRLSKACSKIPRALRADLSKTLTDLQKKVRQVEVEAGPSKASRRSSTPIKDVSASDTSSSTITYQKNKLPAMKFPTFHGDRLKWPLFWEGFTTLLERGDRLTEFDRYTYLRSSIITPEVDRIFKGTSGKTGDFDLVVSRLETDYHDPRHIYRTQVKELVDAKMVDRAGALDYGRSLVTCIETLQSTGQADFEHIMCTLAEMKLTGRLWEGWVKEVTSKEKVPDLKVLTQYLERIGQEHQIISKDKPRSTPAAVPTGKRNVLFTPAPSATSTMTDSYPRAEQRTRPPRQVKPCQLCKVDRHAMHACTQFKAMSVAQRKGVVQRIGLCSSCLAYNHNAADCRRPRMCMDCGQNHHTLLHEAGAEGRGNNRDNTQPQATPASTTPTTNVGSYMARAKANGGIMPTAMLTVETGGTQCQIRAVLDTCSDLTFVSRRMARQLRATIHTDLVQAHTITGNTGTPFTEFVKLTVHTKDEVQALFPPVEVDAYLFDLAEMESPHVDLSHVRRLPFLNGVELADPEFYAPRRVDLLLGLQATSHMFTRRARVSEDRKWCLYDTIFGNIVTGGDRNEKVANPQQVSVFLTSKGTPTDISKFWEIEETAQESSTLTRDEKQAVDYFEETTTREEDRRYVVRLPKKDPTPILGQSKQRAEKRFVQNERALKKKGQWDEFTAVVNEYRDLQHAELVPEDELSRPERDCYYLPMHGVVKDSSTTTKLRVVFDASAKTTNGISLNDILHSGPNQYPLLTTILTKFRSYKIGMTADISKMFREVSLHKQDRDLHRFLWRDDQGTLRTWRMTRLTFGVTSSPFLATQTLLKMATDYQDEFPMAAEMIRHNFYVDDCITGADDLDEAVARREAANNLLSHGGMNLRKWRTNSEELKATIPADICESEPIQTVFAPELSHKTLGVHWDPPSDQMFVSGPEFGTDDRPTKRQVASDMARTYDVMGWLAPAMVKAKCIIQALWILKLDWDEDVPQELAEEWKQWKSELYTLTQHPVPRCYFNKTREKVNVQLHGFSDASKVAYGGVIYIRTFYNDTSTTVSLVTSKTKVAPTKEQTIPRLELCGARLTSRLLDDFRRILDIDLAQVYAWTDSMIVLGWLGQNPGKLMVYISNRVAAITKEVPHEQWRHVPTDTNPADAASRGMMPKELVAHDLWWQGPDWLYKDSSHWPQGPRKRTVDLPGIRKATVLMTHVQPTLNTLIERYSSLTKLVKVMAWILRFKEGCQKKTHSAINLRLTTEEMAKAESWLVRGVQREHFPTETQLLREKQEISPSSKLKNLYPQLDELLVLRIGGRLGNSNLSSSAKHPALLPRHSTLTTLILRRIHLDNEHVGSSTMLALLSDNYHIIGARAAVRNLTRNCVVCRKVNTRNAHQLMGQLPAYRTQFSTPFTHTGIDFAGPITIKSGNPRKPRLTKGYICVYVCMAVKAVHIEVVSDLTSEAFLASFVRFSGRRGLPEIVYSDNGTNFVGAGRELREAYELLQDQTSADYIHRNLTDLHVQWKHTPSRAPHFGGLWESTIKQVKLLLRKSVGGVKLTHEEMETVLIKIESILNSRPLVPLDAQTADGDLAITPGHFLIGKPPRSFPQVQKYRTGSLVRRWNLCQALTKQFADQWSQEYLRTLNRMNKWVRPQRNMTVGDVVLVKDIGPFCNVWPLGRVTAVHPGKDGKVRAVTVKMRNGELQRPVVKLTLLLPEKEQTPTATLPPEDGRA